MSDNVHQDQDSHYDIPKVAKSSIESRTFSKNIHSNNTVDKALELQEKYIRLEYEYEKVKKDYQSAFDKGKEEGKKEKENEIVSDYKAKSRNLKIKWFILGVLAAVVLYMIF